MSLLDDVSIVVTPNGYKAGELYAVIPVPTEGAEEVTNGDFATETVWTFTNVGFSVGAVLFDNSNDNIFQNFSDTINTIYKLTITKTGSGTLRLRTGYAGSAATKIDIPESGILYFTSTSDTNRIQIYGDSGSVSATLNSVSVKEWTGADMDVTRATAATRVDENGLVNYAEIIGDELVADGSFPTGTSEWGTGTGVTVGSGVATFTSTPSGQSVQQNAVATALPNGSLAKVSFEVLSRTEGSFGIYFSGTLVGSKSSVGVFTAYFTKGTETSFYIRALGTTSGTISNVSVIEEVRNNVPRIDYTGGGCPHILAEPQRTNLVTYSEDLSQWTLTNGTLTPNATVSPDGTQNAGKVVFNNTGVDLKRTITVVAGQTYTISFYIKLESGTGLDGRFYDNSNGANIDVYDYTSQIQGTEWSRITRSVTAPSGCTEMQIWLLASSSSLVTASFWGAQFELGSYPTSLIPTSGSTVTRNQDVFSRDGIGSLINDSEGVLFLEASTLENGGINKIISLSDGTNNNLIYIRFDATASRIYGFARGSSGSYTSLVVNNVTQTNNNKIALVWDATNFRIWINGSERATTTINDVPVGMSNFSLTDPTGGNILFGKVKQLQVYDTALTDEQLLQLTGESGTDFYESYAEMAEALTYTIQ